MTVATAPLRMSRDRRRDQLLDAASIIVGARGAAALTMEGLAEHAGVSKALPYQHFDNADAAVAALYDREVALIGQRVSVAFDEEDDGVQALRAAIHAYFNLVAERGHVLRVLASTGVTASNDPRLGHRFVADLIQRATGVTSKRALAAGTIAFTTIHGAIESWVRRDLPRAEIEDMVVMMALATTSAGEPRVSPIVGHGPTSRI